MHRRLQFCRRSRATRNRLDPWSLPLFALAQRRALTRSLFSARAATQRVRRIVPSPPTTVPVSASLKNTPKRSECVSLNSGVHVTPPSVVRRIVPYGPTTIPLFASVKKTPSICSFVLLGCLVQIPPPPPVRS